MLAVTQPREDKEPKKLERTSEAGFGVCTCCFSSDHIDQSCNTTPKSTKHVLTTPGVFPVLVDSHITPRKDQYW